MLRFFFCITGTLICMHDFITILLVVVIFYEINFMEWQFGCNVCSFNVGEIFNVFIYQ